MRDPHRRRFRGSSEPAGKFAGVSRQRQSKPGRRRTRMIASRTASYALAITWVILVVMLYASQFFRG
jgi:hypothetical protein